MGRLLNFWIAAKELWFVSSRFKKFSYWSEFTFSSSTFSVSERSFLHKMSSSISLKDQRTLNKPFQLNPVFIKIKHFKFSCHFFQGTFCFFSFKSFYPDLHIWPVLKIQISTFSSNKSGTQWRIKISNKKSWQDSNNLLKFMKKTWLLVIFKRNYWLKSKWNTPKHLQEI